MSAATTTDPARVVDVEAGVRREGGRSLFARLLEERYTANGESQHDVAEWLNDYMGPPDLFLEKLETELAEIERSAPDEERDATMDAIAVIRNHLATNAQAADYQVGQAAVSKWKNRDASRRKGSSPTPEKWVALSRYMGLSLAALHRLIVFSEMPEAIVALQRQLASARKENEALMRDLEQIRAEHRRIERAQRATDEALAIALASVDRGAVSVS